MIINWVATKAQQFLAENDADFDELNINFDFALSPEIISLLYAQNDSNLNTGDRAQHEEADQQTEEINTPAFALDEHELALA